MSQSPRRKPSRLAYWQNIVDQWSRSGQTQAMFCRERGISYGSFTGWKRRLASSADGDATPHRSHGRQGCKTKTDSFAEKTKVDSFVEVQMPGSVRRPAYEVILGQGRVLRIYDPFDSESVSRLITAVEAAC